MPYAVDNDRFTDSYKILISKKAEIRRELKLPLEHATLLFSGKLIDKKRPFDLLRAYEKLHSNKTTLLFMGEGTLRKELEAYCKQKDLKNAFFLGFKNQNELSKYYIASDIFVLPSGNGETWGLALNEAMCFQLPVITSDSVGAAVDLVKNGENGFICREGDIDQMAEHIKQLIDDPTLRHRLGKASLQRVQKWNYEADLKGLMKALKTCRS